MNMMIAPEEELTEELVWACGRPNNKAGVKLTQPKDAGEPNRFQAALTSTEPIWLARYTEWFGPDLVFMLGQNPGKNPQHSVSSKC